MRKSILQDTSSRFPACREDSDREAPTQSAARKRATCWRFLCLVTICLLLRLVQLRSTSSTRVYLIESDVDACRPFEIHLGVTEDPTTLRLTWRTRGELCPSHVRYRLAKNGVFQTVQGFSYVGDSALLCGGTAATFRYRLYLHTALLADLIPDAPYLYRLPLDVREFAFHSRKLPGSSTPFTFFALADSGVARRNTLGAKVVRDSMSAIVEENGMPDFFLDMGDLSNADRWPSDWDLFMKQIQPFASHAPWIVGMGNHEYDIRANLSDPWGLAPYRPSWGNMEIGTSDGECVFPTFWRFPTGVNVSMLTFLPVGVERKLPLPFHGEPFPPFYFSFRHGTLHVIFFSTEHSVEPGSAQRTWLERELESIDRCLTPFVLLTTHRPFYAPRSRPGDFTTGLGLRDLLEKLLIEHRVDVVISGHVHNHYRLCEAKQNECVPPGHGLISIVLGSGGDPLLPVQPDDFSFKNVTVNVNWGFGKFTVQGTESMEFEFIESKNGKVVDTYSFKNQQLCRAS